MTRLDVCAVVLVLVVGAAAECRVTQPCQWTGPDSPCIPRPTYPNETEPQPFSGAPYNVCPQYANSSCCTHNQRAQLEFNFALIESAFGEAAQGCEACVQNMKDMWCEYVCGPDQSFIEVVGVKEFTDPSSGATGVKALETNVNIDKKWACEMYESCAGTSKVKEFTPLSSCYGFLNYEGITEGIGHGEYMNFIYVDETVEHRIGKGQTALKCCNFQLPGQEGNHSCPCASCKASCDGSCVSSNNQFSYSGPSISVLQGFNFWVVGIMYAAVAIASTITVFCQRRPEKTAAPQAGSSDDKYQPMHEPVASEGQRAGGEP